MTDTPGPIQIWSPFGNGWLRPPVGPYGDHYSAVAVLPGRRSTRSRLVLVGESVATGYLYAPGHTPAGVLAELLPSCEVIDLARTNESLESLALTVRQAMQLEPDVIVMWAGNNWWLRDLGGLSPYDRASGHRVAFGSALRADGLAAAGPFASAHLRNFVRPHLEAMAAEVAGAGARLIVVVPEVNLVDWQSCQPTPVLPDGRESEWHDALAGGDGSRMATIDAAATSTTWRYLGLAEPPGVAQLDFFRREVAAASGPLRATMASPMASTEVQELLREWADTHRFDVVDIPALIEAAGATPDRTWFLDYCHHTHHGISQVTRVVAERVADGTIGASAPPPAELQAVAALGALLHTDHRMVASNDRGPLLRHWRSVAEATFEGADALIAEVIESRLAGAAAVPLTTAQRRNRSRPHPFGFAHGWRPFGLELDALTALGASDRTLSTRDLPAERAWPVDLALRPGRTLWPDEQPGSPTRGFLRAVWPTTDFAVEMGSSGRAEVTLTVRTPSPGQIQIALGEWLRTWPVHETWTTIRFSVPSQACPPGLHPLRITWPRLAIGPDRWHAMLGELDADRPARLHPIFGEVHSLRIG